ncbi:type II secretion system protein GspH [Ectothiorhodospiraceae bacterium BW-2]|nr:type II secretion system protein GspH [Ectothiorhodospiraceae bacterium BW-2]
MPVYRPKLSPKTGGFTLLELMVVLVIIAIIMAMAVLSVGDGGLTRRLQQERQRLATLIELAGDEAILRGQVIGVRFEQDSYRFMHYEAQQWLPYEADKIFRPRQLPEGGEFKLWLEELEVSLEEDLLAQAMQSDEGELPETRPHIMLLSSGERTPFEVELHHPLLQQPLPLSGDILGEIHQGRGAEREQPLESRGG